MLTNNNKTYNDVKALIARLDDIDTKLEELKTQDTRLLTKINKNINDIASRYTKTQVDSSQQAQDVKISKNANDIEAIDDRVTD